MRVGVIGINHKTAEVNLREQFAKVCHGRLSLNEGSFVLLSTCNRTEIYFSSHDLPATHSFLLNILRLDIHEEFEHKIYSYFGGDCFLHLAGVTAGLDSAVLGETEIQGQVKQAYEGAHNARKLSPPLHFLFQKSLKIGKDTRSSVFDLNLPSIADTILFVSEQLLGDLLEKKILLVGFSAINRKLIKALKQKKNFSLSLCNRSEERGRQGAEEEGIFFLPWEKLDLWKSFDVIIFGTKATHYLIGEEKGLSLNHPKLVIDLGVPRNVDPHLCSIVSLLNIDQLNHVLDSNQTHLIKQKIRLYSQLVAEAVERQLAIFTEKEEIQRIVDSILNDTFGLRESLAIDRS